MRGQLVPTTAAPPHSPAAADRLRSFVPRGDPDCLKCVSKRTDSPTAARSLCASPRAADMPNTAERFTFCQIRRHCTAESCWLVSHGKVYDVTKVVRSHPGGANSILRHAGKESSDDFDFHSTSGRKMYVRPTPFHHNLISRDAPAALPQPILTPGTLRALFVSHAMCGSCRWGPLQIGRLERCASEPGGDGCVIS